MPTPSRQLLSRTIYATDGSTTDWEFAFSGGYLSTSHVKAKVTDAIGLDTPITVLPAMLTNAFTVRIVPALAAGSTLTIYRDTPKDLPIVDFTDEAGFTEIALDTNAKQAIFVAAEATDASAAINDVSLAASAALQAADQAAASAAAAAADSASVNAALNVLAGFTVALRASGTGTQTVFPIAAPAGNISLTIFVNGVYQHRNTWTFSGSTVTFTEAPVAGTDNIEFVLDVSQPINQLPSTSVTTQRFTLVGGETTVTLDQPITGKDNVQGIYLNGLYRQKDTYDVSAALITFTNALEAGTLEVVVYDADIAPFTGARLTTQNVEFPASGGTTERTLDAKLRDVINVKDYGAVGDGIVNDKPAVQLAANAAAGKCLYFPPGTYKIVDGFDIAGNNTTVKGDGATILYPQTSAAFNHCIRIFGNFCSVSDLVIQSPTGLVRDDTGFAISAGSVATATKGLTITNCHIRNIASAGIWVSNVALVSITGNVISECLADGIHLSDGCFDGVVSGNVLRDNGDDHIAVVNDTIGGAIVGRTSITGNAISGGTANSGHGVALIGVASGVVLGNHIANTRAAGIGTYLWTDAAAKTDQLLISGNRLSACGAGGDTFGGCGISLQHSAAVTISGNTLSNMIYDGSKLVTGAIAVTDATRLVVSGNTFDNNACDQLVIKAGSDVVVSGNTFGFCAREGVLINTAVTAATVVNNVFTGTSGTNDINVNLPTGTVRVANNVVKRGVAVAGTTVTTAQDEAITFTPVVTAESGSITAAVCNFTYQKTLKFVYVTVELQITDNGTGAGSVAISLPFTAAGGGLIGRENSVTGVLLNGTPQGNTIVIRAADNTYPGGTGRYLTLAGVLRLP